VDDLPWYDAIQPLGSSLISGVTDLSIPVKGSVVIVSFFDAHNQYGIVLGCIGRKAEEKPDNSLGFSDPDGTYPKDDYLNESPISRIARNEKISETIVQTKKNSVKTGVACDAVTFDEPQTQYDAEYPYNRVIETQSGHVLEFDDTEGKERIHIYHKSGSFQEYHPNGDIVQRVKEKLYTIVLSDNNIYIGGKCNVHIESDANIQVNGKVNLKTTGNTKLVTSGSATIESSSSVTVKATSTTNIDSGGKIIIKGAMIDLDGGGGASGELVLKTSPCPVYGVFHNIANCTTVKVSL
jgi:hypothetical protein